MDENVTRLRAAIEASRRRIDAVMAAIREQISDNAPYGANGRISARSPRMRDLIVGLHEDWLMTSTSSRATGSTRSPLRILHLCETLQRQSDVRFAPEAVMWRSKDSGISRGLA
jgi:hypothetical protein